MPTTIESMLIVFIVTFYYILVNKTEMVNFIESLLLSSVIIVYNRYDSYNSHNSNAYQVYILLSQVGTNPKGVQLGTHMATCLDFPNIQSQSFFVVFDLFVVIFVLHERMPH